MSSSCDPDQWNTSLGHVGNTDVTEFPDLENFEPTKQSACALPPYNHAPVCRQMSSSSSHSTNPSDAASDNAYSSEMSVDSSESESVIYEFWETREDLKTLHRIHLQPVGASTAGVYRAQAIPKTNHTSDALFYDGKPFILKLYDLRAAEAVQSQVGVDLFEIPDEAIASYHEMRHDGRLQDYVDSLAEELETSTLPTEIQELFEERTIIKAQIVRYALDSECHEPGVDLMAVCKEARLVHEDQDTIVYRLAFAMFWIACTRHKEFAVHLLLKQHISNYHGVVPSMISFLKLSTKNELFNSLTTDAIAIELFQGATLLDMAESVDAAEVFSQMSDDQLHVCLQDVVHLGSCLLPLGLQQRDTASRNVFVRFDAKSGYLTTSWIDLESVHPIQGDAQARHSLEQEIKTLLEEQDSYEGSHFQISLAGMSSQLAFVDPDPRLEQDLRIDFDGEMRRYQLRGQLERFILTCRTGRFDTEMYTLFPDNLLATSIYWSLVKSACKSFAGKPHLVTVYLQVLRYLMRYHLAQERTDCFCWVRETHKSLSKVHHALGLEGDLSWVSVCSEIVMPLYWSVAVVNQGEFEAYNDWVSGVDYASLSQSEAKHILEGALNAMACECCVLDLNNDPLAPTLKSLLDAISQLLSSSAMNKTTHIEMLRRVEDSTIVIKFLATISGTIARTANFFQVLEQMPYSTSRSDFISRINNGTECEPALMAWSTALCSPTRTSSDT